MLDIPTHVEGLIFDLDGTLADTMGMHGSAWHAAFRAFGSECPPEFLEATKGIPGRIIVGMFNEQHGTSIDPEACARFKQSRVYELLLETRPIEPVFETARAERGRRPMAVASGGTRANVQRTLEVIGATQWFGAVLTGDDPVKQKPEPGLFLAAAERIGVAPGRCHVFEDGDPGVEAARAAGMSYTDVREVLEV